MIPSRVHITGASGSGTTTLGRALAAERAVPAHDTDDYFREPTEPPCTAKRDPIERLALVERVFLPRKAWVLSGSVMGWGDTLRAHFDLVVFLVLDPAVRLRRLVAREARRYDSIGLDPGSPHYASHRAFMDWAAGYDDPAFDGRSERRHRAWLATLSCPVLELDGDQPAGALVNAILSRPG